MNRLASLGPPRFAHLLRRNHPCRNQPTNKINII